jgi:ATP-dependent DNA ligase
VPSKAKFLEDQDVHIRGMFPGEGKYYKRGVGGFTYSLTPDGPVLGRVGTGFDDDLRMDMYRNPDAYTGRVARVRHQGAFPGGGALRAPSFIALHEG